MCDNEYEFKDYVDANNNGKYDLFAEKMSHTKLLCLYVWTYDHILYLQLLIYNGIWYNSMMLLEISNE